MRTTLDIADDVLAAARDLALREKKPLGRVISDLARQSLRLEAMRASEGEMTEQLERYCIKPLPPRGKMVSSSLIEYLKDMEGI